MSLTSTNNLALNFQLMVHVRYKLRRQMFSDIYVSANVAEHIKGFSVLKDENDVNWYAWTQK